MCYFSIINVRVGGLLLNLRQKVKRAKKDIETVEERIPGPYTLDIVERFEEKSRLQKIIDYKRKPNRIVNWDDPYKPCYDKLTYMSLSANFEDLTKIVSPNGKPLTRKQVREFINKCHDKIYHYGLKVAQREPNKEMYTDYVLFTSDFRTKQKTLYPVKIYRQYDGDDKLYAYNDE